jgi:hypothetical protein
VLLVANVGVLDTSVYRLLHKAANDDMDGDDMDPVPYSGQGNSGAKFSDGRASLDGTEMFDQVRSVGSTARK